MKLIVGLGNPGRAYENTRHNVGFFVIDSLNKDYNINVIKLKYKALYGDGKIKGCKVMLLKPMTYMNLSGEAVRIIMDYYKITPEEIIVVYDDVSLPLGKIRIREKGSDGGHNGIKSIINNIGTDNFLRIKIGIGVDTNEDRDLSDYVLSKFSKEEYAVIENAVKDVCSAIELVVSDDIVTALNKYSK